MPVKLTEGLIKGLKFEGKATTVRDAKVTGLMVVVNKTGKPYKVQRDLWHGQRGRRKLVKTVRHTLCRGADLGGGQNQGGCGARASIRSDISSAAVFAKS